MNKVYLSGEVATQPTLTEGAVPHMIFDLLVTHRTAAGVRKEERYRVNAWHDAARWGFANLRRGQPVAVQGYLTQQVVADAGRTLTLVDVTATEFLPGPDARPWREKREGADDDHAAD